MICLLTERAENILKERYYLPDEKSWSNICFRVSKFIGGSEDEKDDFYHEMYDMKFIPNSPTLMNAGTDNPMLSACFYLPVEDSIESIFDAIKYGAMIHKLGGGTGYNFSKLRAEGSPVGSTNGVASGPVSFMKIFDAATEQIKQGGKRRGANMGSLMVNHPDIKKFITCKSKEGDIKNFNISVWLTDEFLNHPNEEVMNLIIEGIYKNGEPGLLFYDTVNAANPNPELGALEGVNPCSEAILHPYESCNLGSINLTKFVAGDHFDWVKLSKSIRIAVRFLNKVINKNKYPLKEIEVATKTTRKIGLGVMGWADALIMMGIRYGSDESFNLAEELMKYIGEVAKHENNGNSSLTAIAPTGTISIFANVSSGIEPNFSFVYERKNAAGSGKVINPLFDKELKKLLKTDMKSPHIPEKTKKYLTYKKFDDVYDEVIDYCFKHGSIQSIEWLPDEFKEVFVTAMDISWEDHIYMQAAFQKYVDQSISKTINLPNNATKEDIKKAIYLAASLGCKGLTMYREGSRECEVLSLDKPTQTSNVVNVTYVQTNPPIEWTIQNPTITNGEKRPKELFGVSYKALSGCGKLYVTINYKDKKPYEVFVFTGGNGGCQAQNQAIGRLISVALRNDVNYETIVRQLNRVTCPIAMKNKCDGKSCSDIIGNLLKQSMGDEVERVHSINTFDERVDKTPKNNHVCPECGKNITMSEGCRTCYHCGWSKCS